MTTYTPELYSINQARQPKAIVSPPQSVTAQSSLPSVLNLVERLCQRLAEEQISYCHWKSNDVLERSASGDNDLDLLVSRRDAERFTVLLHELGFKAAHEDPTWQMPGILDYYGYDQASGRLVHAHVHYQLIVGEDMTKNYHLPVEEPYLASTVQDGLFRTPAPEFELIIFIIRMILKHATWDTLLGRWGALAKAERRELAYLQSRAHSARVATLLNEYLPTIDMAFFDRCQAALRPDSSLWTRLSVGRQLQQRLKAHARRGEMVDVGLRFWRRGRLALRRRFAQLPRRRLNRGGALIAIVGGDGAGKTTAVETVYRWLGSDLEVANVHLGKPTWSRTTKVVRALLKGVRTLTGTPYIDWATVLYENNTHVTGFAPYCLALRSLCLARDLYGSYQQARRVATNGTLVVCDRFPLAQVTWMDAPHIEQMLTLLEKPSWLLRRLARLEKSYFQAILPPEVLLVLRLDPEIAVVRRAEESSQPVLVRNQGIWETDWAQTSAQVIDAASPREAVHAALKAQVWSNL
jgi:thymidylate kinase